MDLLFTDVVLPGGMTGAVLAEKAAELQPGIKTLFTTGYARNAIVHHGRLDPGVDLITKPFSYADLAARVRDILDRAGSERRSIRPLRGRRMGRSRGRRTKAVGTVDVELFRQLKVTDRHFGMGRSNTRLDSEVAHRVLGNGT